MTARPAPRWQSLAGHAAEARELLDLLRAAGEDDAEVLETAVEGETGLGEAVARTVSKVRDLEAQRKWLEARKLEIEARRLLLERQEERLRGGLVAAMESTGLPSIPTPEGRVSLVAGRRAVRITAPRGEPGSDVPAEFVRTHVVRDWDKGAIQRALERGAALPFAELSNAPPHVQIR